MAHAVRTFSPSQCASLSVLRASRHGKTPGPRVYAALFGRGHCQLSIISRHQVRRKHGRPDPQRDVGCRSWFATPAKLCRSIFAAPFQGPCGLKQMCAARVVVQGSGPTSPNLSTLRCGAPSSDAGRKLPQRGLHSRSSSPSWQMPSPFLTGELRRHTRTRVRIQTISRCRHGQQQQNTRVCM